MRPSPVHRTPIAVSRSFWLTLLLAVWATSVCRVSHSAQQDSIAETPTKVSAESVRSQLQAVESSPELNEAQRAQAAESYRQALTELEAISSLEATLQKYRQDTEQIASQKRKLEQDRDQLPAEAKLDGTAGLSIEQLDAKVRETQQALEQARSRLTKLEDESKRRAVRRLEVPKTIAGLQEESGRIGNQLAEPPADDMPRQLSEAAKLLLVTRQQKIQLEIDSLRQELAFYDDDEDLLRLQTDVARQQMTLLQQELSLWNEAAAAHRQEVMKSQEQQAQAKATEAAPELADVAASNLELIRKQQELARQIQTAADRLAEIENILSDWDTAFDQVYSQVAPQAVISESIGLDLRNQRRNLPNAARLQRESDDTYRQIFDIRFQQLSNDAELSRLASLDEEVSKQLQQISPSLTTQRIEALKPQMRSLLTDRQESLTGLKKDFKRYLDDLVRLNVKLDALVSLVERYASFIDERVLWIRSTPPIGVSDVSAVAKAWSWLFSETDWQDLLHGLWVSWRSPLAGNRHLPVLACARLSF